MFRKLNETHIKKYFSTDEIKKWGPDNQNLNTFSEEKVKAHLTPGVKTKDIITPQKSNSGAANDPFGFILS